MNGKEIPAVAGYKPSIAGKMMHERKKNF